MSRNGHAAGDDRDLLPRAAPAPRAAGPPRRALRPAGRRLRRGARLHRALREADRRKDDFLAQVAHELRNPMAAMLGAAHALRPGETDPAALEESRDVVVRQVRHMTRLVEDLLDASRIRRGEIEIRKEPVELAGAVARAIEAAGPLVAARGHALSVALPEGPVWLEADPVRLVQVLANLLTNAAKYTEPGGRIALDARCEAGRVLALTVRDSGIGIAPEMLPRVFELFTQVDRAPDRSGGGLGIGLALVKSLVDLHGGTVTAASEGPGRGSTFVVRLPLGSGRPEGGRRGQTHGAPSEPRTAALGGCSWWTTRRTWRGAWPGC
jgi:signal transduction histidine kinase